MKKLKYSLETLCSILPRKLAFAELKKIRNKQFFVALNKVNRSCLPRFECVRIGISSAGDGFNTAICEVLLEGKSYIAVGGELAWLSIQELHMPYHLHVASFSLQASSDWNQIPITSLYNFSVGEDNYIICSTSKRIVKIYDLSIIGEDNIEDCFCDLSNHQLPDGNFLQPPKEKQKKFNLPDSLVGVEGGTQPNFLQNMLEFFRPQRGEQEQDDDLLDLDSDVSYGVQKVWTFKDKILYNGFSNRKGVIKFDSFYIGTDFYISMLIGVNLFFWSWKEKKFIEYYLKDYHDYSIINDQEGNCYVVGHLIGEKVRLLRAFANPNSEVVLNFENKNVLSNCVRVFTNDGEQCVIISDVKGNFLVYSLLETNRPLFIVNNNCSNLKAFTVVTHLEEKILFYSVEKEIKAINLNSLERLNFNIESSDESFINVIPLKNANGNPGFAAFCDGNVQTFSLKKNYY